MAKNPMTLQLPLFLLSLFLSPLSVTAEDFSKSCAADLIVLFSLIFLSLVAFVGYYIRRYGNGCLGVALDLRQEQAIFKAARGLEAAAMDSLPSIRFSEIKSRKIGKGELECTVCLGQFKDQEILCLLPDCCHVFHSDCIKPWLASHVTCPVCREEVSFASKCTVESSVKPSDHHLTVETDGTSSISNSPNNEGVTRGGKRLRRSHSTGELVVRVVEDNSRSRRLPTTEISPKSHYRENIIMSKSKGWNCFSSSSKLDRLVDYYSDSPSLSLQIICIN